MCICKEVITLVISEMSDIKTCDAAAKKVLNEFKNYNVQDLRKAYKNDIKQNKYNSIIELGNILKSLI